MMDRHRKKTELSTWKKEYIFQIIRKYENKSYKKIIIQQM